MEITTNTIKDKIYEDFSKTYRPFGKFIDSGLLWKEFIETVKNPMLMNNIIFCNDVMSIPPVKTFLLANTNLLGKSFSTEEKRALGAFWGYVFKFIFNYQSQKEYVPVNTLGIKQATMYSDPLSDVVVIGPDTHSVN